MPIDYLGPAGLQKLYQIGRRGEGGFESDVHRGRCRRVKGQPSSCDDSCRQAPGELGKSDHGVASVFRAVPSLVSRNQRLLFRQRSEGRSALVNKAKKARILKCRALRKCHGGTRDSGNPWNWKCVTSRGRQFSGKMHSTLTVVAMFEPPRRRRRWGLHLSKRFHVLVNTSQLSSTSSSDWA